MDTNLFDAQVLVVRDILDRVEAYGHASDIDAGAREKTALELKRLSAAVDNLLTLFLGDEYVPGWEASAVIRWTRQERPALAILEGDDADWLASVKLERYVRECVPLKDESLYLDLLVAALNRVDWVHVVRTLRDEMGIA